MAKDTEKQEDPDSTVLDWRYIKGIPAIFKGVEVFASLIAYICVEVADDCKKPTTDYFKFVSMFVFAGCAVLWVFLILRLQRRIFRCDCCNWPLIELGFYVACCILYFFGDLFLALHSCDAGQKVGCVFGFIAFFAIIADGVLAFRTYWKSRSEKSRPLPDEHAAPPADTRY